MLGWNGGASCSFFIMAVKSLFDQGTEIGKVLEVGMKVVVGRGIELGFGRI